MRRSSSSGGGGGGGDSGHGDIVGRNRAAARRRHGRVFFNNIWEIARATRRPSLPRVLGRELPLQAHKQRRSGIALDNVKLNTPRIVPLYCELRFNVRATVLEGGELIDLRGEARVVVRKVLHVVECCKLAYV